MRKSICYKRNFRCMFICVMLLCLLALAGCGNQDTQKDDSLQGSQPAEEQGTQGADSQSTAGQENQGTGNQDSQGTSNQESQSAAGQDSQSTGNQDSQGAAGQENQDAGSQNGQDTASQQPAQGQAGLANQPKIGVEEAKEAALKHAGLSGDEVTFIKEELDYDDGRVEYDIEFVTSTTKYEYEISADDGAVLGTSQEPVEQLSGNTQVQGAISAEEAKEAVLNHAGFTAGQVNFTKVELELDDGVAQYEIEFYANGREYSSKVNASTGAIMEYEMD